MIHEFSRSELLLGKDSMAKLAGSCVAVFGVGGVGSHCIEALARGGVGRLVLIDNDTVSITNINRQSIAYHSTVGMYKTQVMKTRIQDINPKAEVFPFETFVLPDNLEALFEQIPYKVDYIADAIDTVTAKLALTQYAIEHDIPIISSMGTGNKLDPTLLQVTDISKTYGCPLARVMRKELRTRGIHHLKVVFSPEKPVSPAQPETPPPGRRSVPASNPWVPATAGLLLGSAVVRDLIAQVSLPC